MLSESDTIVARRLILVGKCGNGKSSTGNSIFGRQIFTNKLDLGSVTQTCEMHFGVDNTTERQFYVVDTPGLFDPDRQFADTALEIQKAVELCPNPHAFLIIMRADVRLTDEEKFTIDLLRVIFGEKFLEHAILVFTRGSKLDIEYLDKFLAGNKSVDNLKNECRGRVTLIENDVSVDSAGRANMIRSLFDMVEEMSDGGKKSYQYRYLHVHRIVLKKHSKNRRPGPKLNAELSYLIHELAEKLNSNWRPHIVGLLVGAAVAATSLGSFIRTVLVDEAVAHTKDVAAECLCAVCRGK